MQLSESVRASEVSFNEGMLRLAAVHGRTVEFRYAKSPSAPIETRSFVPENVYVTRNGDTIVVGPDPDRDDVRAFRLDRILGDVTLL